MSAELVPTTYERLAWNTLQHPESSLPHQDSALTARQAKQIKDNFVVDIFPIVHGITDPDSSVAEKLFSWPTELEYEVGLDAVKFMPEDGVLFIEAIGHTTEADIELAGATQRTRNIRHGDRRMLPATIEQRMKVEDHRANRTTSVIGYVGAVAALEGLEVHYADIDAFEYGKLRKLAGPRLDNTHDGGKAINRVRELRAANTVKNWMLENMPANDQRSNRKRQVGLMFGGGHEAGLVDAFNSLRIRTNVHKQRRSTEAARVIQNMELILKLGGPDADELNRMLAAVEQQST